MEQIGKTAASDGRYVVSALKYRPLTFASVVGQKRIVNTLRQAILSNRIAPAYLFCGPRGVGKTTTARIFARTINCAQVTPEGEACGKCASCLAYVQGQSLDFYELDAASNNQVDDMRSWVEQIMTPGTGSRYKVFVMDEVHMLSTAAFNIFLKVLESPPSYARFILCTTEKHKVIPSILSLCQTFDFEKITLEDTVDHLAYIVKQEGATAEPEALRLIATKADGGMRDALSLLDQLINYTGGQVTYTAVSECMNTLDYEYYFTLGKAMLEHNYAAGLLLLEMVLTKGFGGEQLLSGMAHFLRDILLAKDTENIALLGVTQEVGTRYVGLARALSDQVIFDAMKLIDKTIREYRVASNKRLTAELCILRLCQG